ncbi:hypothetical protein ASE75_07700 [Sphingomonas sp. Leaf17]|uniref:hypothetical protein n=1 Tax=Sphingomonas sp. Leaf17 TaxID=1735683 RepID=UPI0006F267EB|nr:hypothetical protein [Sphingomonas sp. Leaf17]KQM64942.1 hypothetical protein ASE75_07700 [Sphingomonas sp. Leaf17]
MPYIADSRSVLDAVDLIAAHGEEAALFASIRADRSRDIGNHVRFCHWRQIERLIVLLGTDHAPGTVQ